MDSGLEEKIEEEEKPKIYIQNDEVDEWISSLYKTNNYFEIEFEGKFLKFQKRIPISVANEIAKFTDPGTQINKMIAILSVQPHFNEDQASKLPQDLLTVLKDKFKILFPQEEKSIKK